MLIGTFASGQARDSFRVYQSANRPVGNFASRYTGTSAKTYSYSGHRRDITDYETAAKFARKMIRAAV